MLELSTIYVIVILRGGEIIFMNLTKLNSVWENVLNLLEIEISDNSVFDTFFSKTKLCSIEGNTAFIEVPTKFAKELLETKYRNNIVLALKEVTKTDYICIIKLENDPFSNQEVVVGSSKNIEVFPSNLNTNYTFENFVVGPSNQEAHSASLAAALEPGKFYNPLFIYGKSGIGKTHLLHAIGNYVRLKSKKEMNVYYTSSGDFLDNYVNSIRRGEADELKDKFKLIDILLIDDIQFLSGKEKTNEMFFHIFNHLINNEKQIVITSDRSPNELKGLEDRLVSRFSSGLSVSIRNPEYETSVEILKKKVELQDYHSKTIKEDVYGFIALKYSKDIRQLEGALNRLIFYAESFKKQTKVIDLELAHEALKGLVVDNKKIESNSLSPEKIKMCVADYYKISVSQMVSATRISNVSNARHIAMYFIRSLLDLPFAKIGYEFGGRDHSTVISACSKVDKLLKKDPNFKQAIEDIKTMLK